TPTTVQTATGLQLRAVDQDGRTATSGSFDIAVADTLLLSTNLPAGSIGVEYAGSVSGRGGRGPYAYALATGALPPGLTLEQSGRLTGKPTTAGSYGGISFRVVDADGRSWTQPFSFIINVAPALSAGISPAPATLSSSYTAQVGVTGGRGPFVYDLIAGTLPSGLRWDGTTGLISGTPTAVQVASGLQVRVTDVDRRVALTDVFAIAVSSPLRL
ncbi:putative Ig domain-containing protein, partial [Methylobacterium hispanicum]